MTGDPAAREPDGRRRRGLERRRLLVDAAMRVIARAGVAGVTHRSVAAEAGVPKSAVTHHYASLDDLLLSALRADTDQLVVDLPRHVERPGIEGLAGELVRFARAHRDRVLVGYELYLLASRRAALRPAVEHWLTVLGRLVAEHAADATRARACVAAVDGYVLQCLAAGAEPDEDELGGVLRCVLGPTSDHS